MKRSSARRWRWTGSDARATDDAVCRGVRPRAGGSSGNAGDAAALGGCRPAGRAAGPRPDPAAEHRRRALPVVRRRWQQHRAGTGGGRRPHRQQAARHGPGDRRCGCTGDRTADHDDYQHARARRPCRRQSRAAHGHRRGRPRAHPGGHAEDGGIRRPQREVPAEQDRRREDVALRGARSHRPVLLRARSHGRRSRRGDCRRTGSCTWAICSR